jgi:c-di-AMP phosphodiesterase-like protein
MMRKYDRDKYLLVFERKHLRTLIQDKFQILDAVKSLSPDPIPLTLSIGIGTDGESFADCLRFALLAIDMALSRGGDQVVIKNMLNFEFYGGQAQEIQKRTKVKSRVMANALAQLIKDSGIVLVMGHKLSDLDSIGSSAGIVCAARKLGKRAYIVVDRHKSVAPQLLARLGELPEYQGVIISPTDAILMADNRTLLVVSDISRPEMVESEELLLSCNRVVVIDHHRRSARYIDNAALNFHEPYASSASELVSELLGYMGEGAPMLKTEAEAMLAGIVLDTKNFSMRTGVRTFEAAARLRLAGADTVDIKRLFQTDFESCIERFDIVRRANMHHGGIAVSLLEESVDRTVAAQAADELLNVQGVQASFVVFPEGEQTIISARSLGQINVQVILEKLGGGGHLNMAGAQIKGQSPEIAISRLYQAIDDYMAKNEK